MICRECNSEFFIELKYWAYYAWLPLETQRDVPANIIPFCGTKCSLEWYQKKRKNNET